jgi:hypothetical protein
VETNDLGTLVIVSTNPQLPPASRAAQRMRLHRQRCAAQRMRLHRQRLRLGLRCIVVELRETEVDELVRRGLLSEDARNDPVAVRQALYSHLDQTLAPNRWSAA